MKTVALFIAMITLSASVKDEPNDGMAKYTMSVSNPLDALDWAIGAGWPLVDCRTDDEGSQCNGVDDCGLIGRSSLCNDDGCTGGTGVNGDGFMFPHMINASARPYDALSVEETEAQFTVRVEKAYSTNVYDPYLDYSLVLYAKNLDKWINTTVSWVESQAAAASGANSSTTIKPYFALSWTDNQDAQWYSVIMHIPNTQVIIELISETKPSMVANADLVVDPLMRFPATGLCTYNSCSDATENYWVPLAVSKSISDIETISTWYKDVLGAAVASEDLSQDGIKLQTMYFPKMANMQVRFVQRDVDPFATTDGMLSVAEFEAEKFKGHDRALGRSQEESALCGVSKWYDNHWGIDESVRSSGEVINAMNDKDWPYFHLWSWNMYVVDPSGDAIQWDAPLLDMPEWYVFAEDDSLQNLCTQGNCTGYTASDDCTAKLTELCSQDVVLDCFDCVHWKWDELKTAGCYNADTVNYCGE